AAAGGLLAEPDQRLDVARSLLAGTFPFDPLDRAGDLLPRLVFGLRDPLERPRHLLLGALRMVANAGFGPFGLLAGALDPLTDALFALPLTLAFALFTLAFAVGPLLFLSFLGVARHFVHRTANLLVRCTTTTYEVRNEPRHPDFPRRRDRRARQALRRAVGAPRLRPRGADRLGARPPRPQRGGQDDRDPDPDHPHR